MADEKTRLEIAHVLFIDIVGYSKLLVNEESERSALPKTRRVTRTEAVAGVVDAGPRSATAATTAQFCRGRC
jgi:hypothetical protein